MIKIQNLVENNIAENKALQAEHGLSFFVETPDHKFLFDCGASNKVLSNSHRLGIDLAKAEAVILSHSHFDHSYGYRDVVEADLAPKVLYHGPSFWQKKYAKNGMCYNDLSCGFDQQFLKTHGIVEKVVTGTLELAKGLWLISDFKRTHGFETIPKRFVKATDNGIVADDFADEICLVMETEKGLVVLVGCSHPGILNMISTIHERLHKPIYGVIGGTHLMEADEERIAKTLKELKELGICIAGLCHCSGDLAREMISQDVSLSGCQIHVGGVVFL